MDQEAFVIVSSLDEKLVITGAVISWLVAPTRNVLCIVSTFKVSSYGVQIGLLFAECFPFDLIFTVKARGFMYKGCVGPFRVCSFGDSHQISGCALIYVVIRYFLSVHVNHVFVMFAFNESAVFVLLCCSARTLSKFSWGVGRRWWFWVKRFHWGTAIFRA